VLVEPSPAEYWTTFDPDFTIDSVTTAFDWVEKVGNRVQSWQPGLAFRIVYRGHRDSGYGLTSSLYRSLTSPTEKRIVENERRKLLPELRRWQLHLHASGLLPALPLLATLQHLGGKTRLIDVTHSIAVALWFAVESTEPNDDANDGRLYALTYSEDLATSTKWQSLQWQDEPFWWAWPDNLPPVLVWTPPPVEQRMTRQQAAFLVEQVPAVFSAQLRQLPNGDIVRVAQWREITSLPKRAHRLSAAGRPPATDQILFTARVPANAKPGIRKGLDQVLGISERTMYPDLPGFVTYHR
jgi:hypothetical protein